MAAARRRMRRRTATVMTVAQTAYGKVRGTEIADGVLAWRGIPYAAPPVGELRLRPPRPPRAVERHQGRPRVREPVAAAGPRRRSRRGPPQPPMAEDCLYLNVTAPAGALSTGARQAARCCCGSTAAASRWATAPTRRATARRSRGAMDWSWSPSTTGSARSASSTSPVSGRPGRSACTTRSRRCAGPGRTSRRSAATRSRSPSTGCRRAASRSPTCWPRRSPRASSGGPRSQAAATT